MPWKPKKPCAYPGCPELTTGRYCPRHKKQVEHDYNVYGRSPEQKKRYGSAWRKIRARFLVAHPLCEKCREAGRLTAATEVHHILPLAHGGTNDEQNLMALCKSCHSRITAESGDRWHNR